MTLYLYWILIYWSWNSNTLATRCEELTHWKRPWYWERLKAGGKEDEMVGWHHRPDGHEFEWTPGVGDGQGGLVCCDLWGRKESDTTEQLNWTKYNQESWLRGREEYQSQQRKQYRQKSERRGIWRFYTSWFKDGRWAHKPNILGNLWRMEKSRNSFLLLELTETL